MKKLLGIAVLSLLWCDVGLAKTLVKLPKDTSSGFKKVHKSLTGKYYKDYGMQVVDKKDGHPVRAGDKSIRFEVRSGDCGSDPDGWSDCKNDRERHELTVGGKKDLMSKGEYWFSWSVYFPEEHQNLYPLSNNYGQFHQRKGEPVFMFKERKYSYSVVKTIGEDDYEERKLVGKNVMPGKWHDILVHAKWSKKKDGFFKVWVNNELKYDYKGPTKTKQYVYYKFGVYRTGISRYLNYKNLDGIEKCFEEKGYTTEEYTTFYKFQGNKYPGHKNSIKLYNKCKDYYQNTDVPTTIVYFDEVRKGKKKEKVGIIK